MLAFVWAHVHKCIDLKTWEQPASVSTTGHPSKHRTCSIVQ